MKIKNKKIIQFALVLLTVGIPNFIKFDPTGLTRDYGLFNMQSIARIILFLVISYSIVIIFPSNQLKIKKHVMPIAPFFFLYCYYLINSILFLESTNLLLSLYRIFEWMVIYFLFYKLYNLDNKDWIFEFKNNLPIIIFTPIMIVVFISFFAPNYALSIHDVTGVVRFGGILYNPNLIGILSSIGIVYYYYYSSKKRFFYILVLIIVLLLSYSRGALGALILSVFIYKTVIEKNSSLSFYYYLLFFSITFLLGYIYKENILVYLSRGQDFTSLLTANERTYAWLVALLSFVENPLFGTGYIVGGKALGSFFNDIDISHWYVTTAHNDFLQAMVNGGIIPLLLTLYIFFKHLYNIYQISRIKIISEGEIAFFWIASFQVIVYSILTPSINYVVSIISVVTIWIFIEVEQIRTRLA